MLADRSDKPLSKRDIALVFSDIEPIASGTLTVRQHVCQDWPIDSLSTAVDCRAVLNKELLEICQRNLNANFSFAKRLGQATNLKEAGALQTAHLTNQLRAFMHQGDEVLSLSAHLMRCLIASALAPWAK